MHKTHHMPRPQAGAHRDPLVAGQDFKAIVNLRGNAQDPAFLQAVQTALGLPLPTKACSTLANAQMRIVWAGPDDWLIIAPPGQQDTVEQSLRAALASQHCAVTDVSSGYFQVSMSGAQVRDVLAQGCPMDFHPSVFRPGQAVGTHFFKVGIYLWQSDEKPTFEMLVRRSFIDHFWLLVSHCTLDCGSVARQAARKQ